MNEKQKISTVLNAYKQSTNTPMQNWRQAFTPKML